MTITGYEIDFLPVGEKSSSGDAILFRYEEDGKCKVMLIDGGHKESDGVKTSDTIIKHMRKHYYPAISDSDMRIDHIICSHPDNDHVGGLQDIMEKCDVGTLWVNDPIEFASYTDLEDEVNSEKFCKNDADTVRELTDIAKKNDIAVKRPLQGESIGPLVVASPSAQFYKKLVKGELSRKGGEKASFKKETAGFKGAIQRGLDLISALWSEDYFKKYPATSVCNESSTVLFGELMDERYQVLLTADAGIEALSVAFNYLDKRHSFQSGSLNFIQMPHHGSRHNVNTEILDGLLGQKNPKNSPEDCGVSFASVAKEADGHPKKAVVQAFITRGYSCFSTSGHSLEHKRGNMPSKLGYSPSTSIPYPNQVEAIDD